MPPNGRWPARWSPSWICARPAFAVLTIGVADVFGGASVLACAAQRIALLPGVRLGLSGPAVIETARGQGELDAGDKATVAAIFGAEARAAAGHVELLADGADDVRRFIARGLAESMPFATWVRTMQERLAARLAERAGTGTSSEGRLPPLPGNLVTLYAKARTGRSRWMARSPRRRTRLAVPAHRRGDLRAA